MENIIKNLMEILPHGSGINWDWKIKPMVTLPNRFECSNGFEAMAESGMYCHNYDFTVFVDWNPDSEKFSMVRFSFHGQREKSCCGFGLVEYIQDTIYYALSEA